MARLRFTILGSGASPGVPRITGDWGRCDPAEPRNRRTRCSAMIERFDGGADPTRIVIDTGPDFHRQMITVAAGHLDGVVYTHPHADHVHGIDELRQYAIDARGLIDVYCDDATYMRLEGAFGYCFHGGETGTYPPVLRRHKITPGSAFSVSGPGGTIDVHPFRQIHGEIDSIGVRVGRIAYSSDFKEAPPESLHALADLDLWIIDALRPAPHPSHASVDEALTWIERMSPRRAVFTHMTNQLDYQSLRASLPPGVEPGYDGMQFEFELAD